MAANIRLRSFEKTADEVLDYKVDYSTWLEENSDTISTSAFTVQSGITLDSESNTANTATAILSGGSVGQRYKITSKITTVGGYTREKMFFIYVVNNR